LGVALVFLTEAALLGFVALKVETLRRLNDEFGRETLPAVMANVDSEPGQALHAFKAEALSLAEKTLARGEEVGRQLIISLTLGLLLVLGLTVALGVIFWRFTLRSLSGVEAEFIVEPAQGFDFEGDEAQKGRLGQKDQGDAQEEPGA
jgi:hypothetical protein